MHVGGPIERSFARAIRSSREEGRRPVLAAKTQPGGQECPRSECPRGAARSLRGPRDQRQPVDCCVSLLGRLVLVAALGISGALGMDTPVTPKASPEVQSLLAYCSDIYGQKILSGQQEGWRGTNALGFELTSISNITGKLPAILGLDLSAYTRTDDSPWPVPPHAVVHQARDWYQNRGGVVTLCWHWTAPIGDRKIYSKDTSFDLQRAVTEGTAEHRAALRDLDAIAEELALLRDARVPVLWRPLHEANGRWFWWGAAGPEPFKRMWRLMFERFTHKHRLNNLIWVYSPGAATDSAAWYPGDPYVDIIGQDHYPMDGNHGAAKDVFDELVTLGRGHKLVGLSENGPIPDPDRLTAEKAGWFCFTTWSGRSLTQNNSDEDLRKVYHHPYVLNLGDLPDLRRYRYQPAGPARRLTFPTRLADFPIGSLARQPVSVAVVDREGRTVREGQHVVTLEIRGSAAAGRLRGTRTATTVNGVATFPDLLLDQPGRCSLTATARGLGEATSPSFNVGPGSGILREWWGDLAGQKLADIPELATAPAGRAVIGPALEVPVGTLTNFGARSTALLLPPVTGAYEFRVDSEVASELWLSTDETAGAKVRIVQVSGRTPYSKWPHTHEAQSEPVALVAGRRYYLQVVQKPGNGATQLCVGWRLPNGVVERPISGANLSPLERESSR
jgi:mannan endo-1,4-beta-mannosidase